MMESRDRRGVLRAGGVRFAGALGVLAVLASVVPLGFTPNALAAEE